MERAAERGRSTARLHQRHGGDALIGLTVFVLAVVVRVAASFHFVPSPNPLTGTSDGPGYQQLAVGFANGHFLSDPLYVLRPPGLPWLLGALYRVLGTHSPTVFVGLSVVCTSFTAVVAMRIARLVGLTARRSLLVGCAVAVDPTFVLIGLKPLSDPLFALACTSAALFLLKARRAQYRGPALPQLCLTLVVAVLVKPSAVLLWVIPCAALVLAKRPRTALLVAAVALLPVVGWTVRNYTETGIPAYSTVTNYNMLFYRASGTEARAEGKDDATVILPAIERELARRLHYATVEPYTYYAAPTSKKMYDEELALAFHILAQHPAYYFGAIPIGLERLYLQSEEVPSGPSYELATAWYVAAFAAAAFKWRRIRRDNAFFAWLVAAFVAYFSLTTVIDITSGFGGTRIAMPFLPLVFVAAVWSGR